MNSSQSRTSAFLAQCQVTVAVTVLAVQASAVAAAGLTPVVAPALHVDGFFASPVFCRQMLGGDAYASDGLSMAYSQALQGVLQGRMGGYVGTPEPLVVRRVLHEVRAQCQTQVTAKN